jgi:UDP-2-acetamido-2-deoxy-ribo-hexuluronate aminotransferase
MEFIDLKTQYAEMREIIDARIQMVLDHGQYILGPEVRELEDRLAAYSGARNCITVASGTEALLIALMALGVKPGDEVITTPFTFVATAEMVVLLGATPVFVDVEEATGNIAAGRIEAAITPRTRALLPVALYGQPADMDEINAIAARHRLPVIEDAAQSFGATYKGAKSGNLSTIGCTSFFPSKPLGCYGDGGAIFTNDDALAKVMREIRIHGQERRYVHTRIGVGGRMDSIQCAVVLAKLKRFDWELERRVEIADHYHAQLSRHMATMPVKPERTSAYAQFTVRSLNRPAFEASMKAQGVPTAVHYPMSLHKQPAYLAYSRGAVCPVAEQLAGEVISLPMHPYLSREDQNRVIEAATRASDPRVTRA